MRLIGHILPRQARGAVHVRPSVSSEDVVCFAVVGTVGLDGWAEANRDAFRLTCVAVREKERRRLQHFHG
jgi:hypothetical protein